MVSKLFCHARPQPRVALFEAEFGTGESRSSGPRIPRRRSSRVVADAPAAHSARHSGREASPGPSGRGFEPGVRHPGRDRRPQGPAAREVRPRRVAYLLTDDLEGREHQQGRERRKHACHAQEGNGGAATREPGGSVGEDRQRPGPDQDQQQVAARSKPRRANGIRTSARDTAGTAAPISARVKPARLLTSKPRRRPSGGRENARRRWRGARA